MTQCSLLCRQESKDKHLSASFEGEKTLGLPFASLSSFHCLCPDGIRGRQTQRDFLLGQGLAVSPWLAWNYHVDRAAVGRTEIYLPLLPESGTVCVFLEIWRGDPKMA